MQLYTINATPWSEHNLLSDNQQLMIDYPQQVSEVLASFGIEGFTIYKVTGFWRGKREESFKIEIALDEDTLIETVKHICVNLRDGYRQDAVMLTFPDNSVKFI